MIKYGELVAYIKKNHVNWNTDLFDVLKGFFEEYKPQPSLPPHPIQQVLDIPSMDYQVPANGEYTSEDLMDLFST